MGAITYNITNGGLPITVKLISNGSEVASNTHASYGSYQFTGLTVDDYTLEFYELSTHLCASETVYPLSVGDDDVPVPRQEFVCEIYVQTTNFTDWITLQNPFGDTLTELLFTQIPSYGYLTYGETGPTINLNDTLSFPLTDGLYYHSSDTELAAYNDVMKYKLKGSTGYSNEGTITFNVGSCLGEVGECLNGLTIETIYLSGPSDAALLLPEYGSGLCMGGHSCNRAFYEVYGNGIYLGDSLMNNTGGTAGGITQSGRQVCRDYQNYPHAISQTGTWTGSTYARYSRIDLTQQQALAVAAAVGGGTVIDFSLIAASITYEDSCSSSPHNNVTWTRISAPNGDVLYNGCPEGYFVSIDVCNPPQWEILLEFTTRSPANTTFDPSIVTLAGDFKWEIGGVEYATNSPSVTLNGTNTNVKLWGFGVCRISQINVSNDHIVGAFDISNEAFSTLTALVFDTNLSMTSITLPPSIDGPLTVTGHTTGIGAIDLSGVQMVTGAFSLYGCNSLTSFIPPVAATNINNLYLYNNPSLSGSLDLSIFTSFGTTARIYVYSLPNVTSITFAPVVTGTMSYLYLYSNGISSLDISMFTSYSTGSYINVNDNYYMTSLITPVSTTGTIRNLNAQNTACQSIDLSGYHIDTSTYIYVYNSPLLQTLSLPDGSTGTLYYMNITNNPELLSVDISGIVNFEVNNADILMYNNAKLHTITTPSIPITAGSVRQLSFYGNPKLQSLDLSAYHSFMVSTSSNINTAGNLEMTSLTLPTTTAGGIQTISIYGCPLLTSLDMSGVTHFSTNASINIYNNATLSQLTLPSSITGTISTFNMYGCPIQSLDLSGINKFVATGRIYVYNMPNLQTVTIPLSITGTIESILIHGNPLLTSLDLSGITSYTVGASINGYNNTSLAQITFPVSTTGALGTVNLYNTALTEVDFKGINFVSTGATLQLQTCPSLQYIKFGVGTTGTLRTANFSGAPLLDVEFENMVSPTSLNLSTITIQNSGLTAAVMNKILHTLNTTAVAGYTSRQITLNGSNLCPDSSSGGYDGWTAVTALTTKGFVVSLPSGCTPP